MNYDDIKNPRLKEIVYSLKHPPSTIGNDINQVLNEADNEAVFLANAHIALENLIEEATWLNHELAQASQLPAPADTASEQRCCDNQCDKTCSLNVLGHGRRTTW